MKNKTFLFSSIGSLMIIALMFITNITTSWSHPWFIYPTFAVLWWPLSVYFAGSKNWKLYSAVASMLISVFFVLVNLITSPWFPWAIFPIFAVAWWPMSMLICGAKRYKLYSVVASALTIVFFLAVNLITSPNTMWFIYPAFAVLWWPMSYTLCSAKKYKLYSVVASALTIALFLVINLLTSAQSLWFLYPAFAVSWWPLSMLFARKYRRVYAVVMSLVTLGLLALINFLYTPDLLWFQWTVFFFLWWPIVAILGKRVKTLTFSIVSALVIIAYFIMQYYVQTPGDHPWYLYIILPAVWWPVTTASKKFRHTKTFLSISMAVFTTYYLILNLTLSPSHLWIIYLIFTFSWAVIGDYFGSRKKPFAFSIWGSLITIALFVLINLMYSPNTIWAVYPAFAIAWWPLSIYFFKVRNNRKIIQE